MNEIWKDIAGHDGIYQVSNIGRVKRLSRSVQYSHGKKFNPHITPEKILKAFSNGVGHQKVTLRGNRKRYIHRLVLEAFVGPCPDGMECRHLDGDEGNNQLDNLQWGTPAQNQNDRVAHGTSNRGERQWQAKLTVSDVLAIRALKPPQGLKARRELGHKFGVSPSTIYDVLHQRKWNWL